MALRVLALVAVSTVTIGNVLAFVTLIGRKWTTTEPRTRSRYTACRTFVVAAPVAGALVVLSQPHLRSQVLPSYVEVLATSTVWSIFPFFAFVRTNRAKRRFERRPTQQ
jgi:hypothetical protein